MATIVIIDVRVVLFIQEIPVQVKHTKSITMDLICSSRKKGEGGRFILIWVF